MGAWYRSGEYLWAVWEGFGIYTSVRKSFVSFGEIYVPVAEPYVTDRRVYGPSGEDVRASQKKYVTFTEIYVPVLRKYEPSGGDM